MIKSSNIKAIENLNVSVTWDKDFSSSPPRTLYPPKIYKHDKIKKNGYAIYSLIFVLKAILTHLNFLCSLCSHKA